MSIIGIDIGTAGCVITTIEKGGLKLVRNDMSELITPSLVGFTEDCRLIGGAADTKIKSNAKNTCRGMKNLIGRVLADPVIDMEKEFLLGEIDTAADGSVGYVVNYKGEQRCFSGAEVMAALLGGLKRLAEKSIGVAVKDVVIGVPSSYGDAQRHAVMNAAEIAGLNCLRVMNEYTAAALDYGIYRQKSFDTEKPTNVIFICSGQSLFSASVVQFTQKGLKVLSEVSGNEAAGRSFDLAIMKHFTTAFDAKHGTSLLRNPKARLKLEDAASKAKKVLSANSEAPFACECIYEEHDIVGMITREEFEAACEGFRAIIKNTVESAVAKSGVAVEDILNIELTGGCTRIPWVQSAILDAVEHKIELSRTLHLDECVSRGAALQAAMLSPLYKVREFIVSDRCHSDISFFWNKLDGSTGTAVIFPAGTEYTTVKYMTLENRKSDIQVSARATLPNGTTEEIGKWTVSVPASEAGIEVKLRLVLDIHGRVSVHSAQSIEHETYTEVVKVKKEVPAPAEGEEPAPEEFEEKTETKSRVHRKDLTVTAAPRPAVMSVEAVKAAKAAEAAMHADDCAVAEVSERLNELESTVYRLRDLCDAGFATDAEKATLAPVLDSVENWVYDEGSYAPRDEIMKQLALLETNGGFLRVRQKEEDLRADAIPAFQSGLDDIRRRLSDSTEATAHIGPEKRAPVIAELEELSAWFTDAKAKQSIRGKNENPVFTVEELKAKFSPLNKKALKVMLEKKPTPPAAPAQGEAEKQQTESGEEAAAGGEPNMDVDAAAEPDMDLD